MSRHRSHLFAAAMLCASFARAAEPASSDSAAAGQHFRRGLEHAKSAELALAATEFEAAYAKSPHYSVLYNLGQAYTALGRSVEAMSAFERYLREGGGNVEPARREQVRALIELNQERVGRLVIRLATPTLRVWLDGEELAHARLSRPIVLAAGRHNLLSTDGSSMPVARVLSVTAGQELTVEVPAPPAAASDPPGQLTISCPVPAVQVLVDGRAYATTPLAAPLLAAPGEHQVTFLRAGYAPASSRVNVRSRLVSSLACGIEPLATLAREHRAWLELDVQPADAQVLLDGRAFRGGALPAGAHSVLIVRSGYAQHQRFIDVAAGRKLIVSAQLTPSPEQQKLRQHAATRRTSGWVLAGLGGAFVATGVSLQFYNAGEYDDWRARRGSASESDNLRSATAIQRVDDLSIGLSIAGASLLAAGTWLLWPALSGQLE